MGAGGFHGRVRDGIGCGLPAKATRLSNPPCHRGAGLRRQVSDDAGLPDDWAAAGSGAVRCVWRSEVDFHAWRASRPVVAAISDN
jgi:hypothetical protein